LEQGEKERSRGEETRSEEKGRDRKGRGWQRFNVKRRSLVDVIVGNVRTRKKEGRRQFFR